MADTEMQGAALARDELCALAEQIQVDVAELVRRTALPPYDGQPYMFDGRAWVRLAAESTRSTADEQPPTESRRIDSLNEAELERAGITVRWNEEPGVPWDEARFYDAAGNELEPEHCVDLPAAGVRPPAEERDDLDDYIAEVRAKDPAFGAAYDDAVARLLRDHPSALAAVATKALSAPLATHYPGDGQGGRAAAMVGHGHTPAVLAKLREAGWSEVDWWRAIQRTTDSVRFSTNSATVVDEVLEAAGALGLLADRPAVNRCPACTCDPAQCDDPNGTCSDGCETCVNSCPLESCPPCELAAEQRGRYNLLTSLVSYADGHPAVFHAEQLARIGDARTQGLIPPAAVEDTREADRG